MRAQGRRNMEEDEAWTDNWVRDGEGKIKTKRVTLDRIVDDSSRLYPPVNVRNLNQTVIHCTGQHAHWNIPYHYLYLLHH